MDNFSNFEALHDFIESHEFEQHPNGNRFFDALVDYSSSKKSIAIKTGVRIFRTAGLHDGKIALTEQDNFTADDFHLDFSADFQTYKFEAKKANLTITGKSPKMGSYTVVITPV